MLKSEHKPMVELIEFHNNKPKVIINPEEILQTISHIEAYLSHLKLQLNCLLDNTSNLGE